MQFHEVRFPASLSFGSSGGPERRTDVVTLANGFEERNTPWEHSRRRYDAGLSLRSMDDIDKVLAFFEARRGRMHGFRWKDWSDFKTGVPSREVSFEDEVIAQGDEETTSYQLMKIYRSGEQTYARPVTKPVEGTVRVGIAGVEQLEGVHYEVDTETGIITFEHAPNEGMDVTAGFEFDVPVRFDTDQIVISASTFQAGEVPAVPVVELRV
ncbi:DUF2460 domain-containing protein [Lentibacter algarum]|uniref:DUF2460 domain-containing protein n=1 Tax=Lentibacter algarum TaxID=576131 RepID=UPI001C07FB5E|nr:DUF2460 domain-containing protein [Lentibacter algarum]MBU2982730.1 DUF2460 domain-containing protein [Lentibacter algarum]